MGKCKRLVAFTLVLALMGSAILKVEDYTLVYAENVSVEQQDSLAVNTENTTAQTQTTANNQTQSSTASDSSEADANEEATTKEAATTERKAVWCSYSDLDFKNKSKSKFTDSIENMFDNVKTMGMNTVIVHVRPFGDAMYDSMYFPWSKIASGKQGKNPGYDPLSIMIKEAHSRNLRIEAWINPYRVTWNTTRISSLSKDNPARIWYSKASTRRNVLIYGGKIYYNPSKPEVRELIVNGVEEIVSDYDVDGIHFDDYFYPTLGSGYKISFDAKEYNAYVKKQKKAGEKYQDIVSWRRTQVSTLVKQVYKTIKKHDKSIEFGISPAGNIDNLLRKDSYYVDINKWVNSKEYVDYICPQIYWGFQNGQYSFDKVLDRWTKLCKEKKIKLYVGMGMYRTVYKSSSEWRRSKTIMQRSIKCARQTKKTDGFVFFTYSSFTNPAAAKEKKNLLKELKKKK